MVNSFFMEDKPLVNVPPNVEAKLKLCVPIMFRDIKFFKSWRSVDSVLKVMDYIFHQLHLKNKDDWKEKTKQAILWECICKWVFKEMTKIRTNKIATFHNIVKSK